MHRVISIRASEDFNNINNVIDVKIILIVVGFNFFE